MVGGYALNRMKGVWKTIGADGYAPNGDEALAGAMEMVNGSKALTG